MMNGAHHIDVQPIDVNGWPGGPVARFLRFNAQPIEGICIRITGFDGLHRDARIARGRAYEIETAETGLRYLVLGDAFCPPQLGGHQVLVLARVFYGLQQELPATQIIWPAGYYGDLWEGRAAEFWMRKLGDHEIARMPSIIRRMARQAGSLYCLNDKHIGKIKSYARSIVVSGHANFSTLSNIEKNLPSIATERLIELIRSALDIDFENSLFGT